MTDALRYEWTRIRTIRSTYWLSVIAVVFGAGLSFLAAMGTSIALDSSSPPTAQDLPAMGPALATQFASFGAPYFVAYILAMIGVFAWGHEYRHGMVRATLTALGSRTASWVAKFVVVGVWVLVVAAVTMLLSLAFGWLWLHDDGLAMLTGGTWSAVGRTLLYTLLFVGLAGAFTALVRNQTAALVLLFLWPLALETVVGIVFAVVPGLSDHARVTRFLPFGAGARIIDRSGTVTSTFGDPLSVTGAVIVFGGLTVAALAASLVLFHRRDA